MSKRNFFLLTLVLLLILSSPLFAQDSLNISMVSSMYHFWSSARDVDVQGDYAYVSTYFGGLCIVDISNPEHPEEVGFADPGGIMWNLCVNGNYAYVADGIKGLRIIDVSDPSAPFETGHCDSSMFTYDVALTDQYAFLSSGSDGVHVADISDPFSPMIVGSSPTPHNASSLVINNDYAYVVEMDYGLRVLDISDPVDPYEVSSFNNASGYNTGIDLEGDHVFLAETYGIFIVDVSDPLNPYEAAFYANPDSSERFWNIDVLNGLAYVGCENGYRIIDVSNPLEPEEIGSNFPQDAFSVISILVGEDYAYLTTGGDAAFRIIDTSDPGNTTEIGGCGYYGSADGLALVDDYMYLTDYRGLRIIDISDPLDPHEVDFINTLGYVREIVVGNGFAYIVGGEDNLCILDISDPQIPEICYTGGNLDIPYIPSSLQLYENYIYMGTDELPLKIIDVSDPYSPQMVNDFLPYYYVFDMEFRENQAFVPLWNEFVILDVSDPVSPVEIGSCFIDSTITNVEVVGDYAYLTASCAADGLSTFNQKNIHREADSELDVFGGILIIDISDPASPVHVNTFDSEYVQFGRTHLDVQDGFAYISGKYRGIQVVDVSDPYNPYQVGYYDTPGEPNSIIATEDYVYLADGNFFEVFDCSAALSVSNDEQVVPREFTISSVYPNPFNMFSFINVSLPQASALRLTVYNELGQEVRILAGRRYEAGNHQLQFNGSGLASGAYFIRAEAGDLLNTRKVVLLK